MALTITDVITKLRCVDQAAQLVMFVNHRLVPVHEVLHVDGSPYVFLCEKVTAKPFSRFTESENGLIGYCAFNGLSDGVIAELLGRKEEAISRQRKKLGF